MLVVGWASLRVQSGSFLSDILHGWGSIAIALDLVLIAIPVVAFMVMESHRLGMRWPWIWVPLILPLPGAFVVPLFFLLRERALLRLKAEQQSAGGNVP